MGEFKVVVLGMPQLICLIGVLLAQVDPLFQAPPYAKQRSEANLNNEHIFWAYCAFCM